MQCLLQEAALEGLEVQLWYCLAQMQRHAHKAAKSKANGSRNTVASKASKRLLYDASVGQLLDDDLRREAKQAKRLAHGEIIMLVDNAHVESALRPNMLPPKLRERFPDAVGGRWAVLSLRSRS